jgi:acylphosphatase
MNKRYHVWISGRVQGVFFRANTWKKARSLGLSGWVRNLPDGCVESVFEGEVLAAEAMLNWSRMGWRSCKRPPPGNLPTLISSLDSPPRNPRPP